MGRIIGILGGMGPLATADLYTKIIRATPATRDQEHLHVIIDADPTVPDRSAFLRGLGPDPMPKLTAGAQRLELIGAAFIAIPCNTAHAFLPALQERIGIPILDMVAETTVRVRRDYPQVRCVGILATQGTIEIGLYHAALRAEGLEPLHPGPGDQERLVSAAIAAVKAGDTGPNVGELLAEAGRRLAAAGAEVLLAACTEIPLALTQAMVPVPLLDPTQVLAEAAVREASAVPAGVGR
jgi:aspartate racemase